MKENKLCLFEGYGIELEYMIVSNDSLAVLPVADQLIKAEVGEYKDVERGPVAWSNELVLHVVELKTNGPAPDLEKVPGDIQRDVNHINRLLGKLKGRLMPTGMHPFMDPRHETRLWPHEHSDVYEMFNRVFDCRGHGWSNVQSSHLNLPFGNDEEFGKLHAAIRLLLPLMPALAASSPFVEGKNAGALDYRMQLYRNNTMRIPSVTGHVIPEGAYTRKDYEMNILARIYQDLSPHDPDGVLQHEWVNARGAIARFDRSAIEIRVLDIQECPQADVAICAAIVDVLKALTKETWTPFAEQKAFPTQALSTILRNVIVQGQNTVITDEKFLHQLHFKGAPKVTAGELWQHLIETVWPSSATHANEWRPAIATILQRGTLAQRILNAVGKDTSRERIKSVYADLCDCLTRGKMFAA